ncbi:MAG: aminopeptidase-like protein [Litorivivens sp.]|jgi:aminopeptidase-like protein
MLEQLESYFDRLWPICRSITGNGLRESLGIINELVPMTMHEIPSGTKCFDWTIPKEWNIKDAWIETPKGKRIAEFKVHNLHIVNYSIPVDQKLSYQELVKHIYTIPEMPDAIPYITSYYSEKWGFCMTHREFEELDKEGDYHVFIDSTLGPGSLTYGEAILKGESDREVLFSTYLCHPSMANNELSGPLVQAILYQALAQMPKRKYTYRFVFAPETVGVIAYLSRIGEHLKSKLDAGFVLTCCGDPGDITYKKSKIGNALCDRVAEHVLNFEYPNHSIKPFAVGGSDERQYCSPGFNLPMGSIIRSQYQEYKEYHTSLDNKEFISFEAMKDTVEALTKFVTVLELNEKYEGVVQHCEPQLGKRGMYPDSVDPLFNREALHNLMHFLSYADGKKDLIEIAEARNRSALVFTDAIKLCQDKSMVQPILK